MAALFPSLISSNLLNLDSTINQLDSICAGFHLDVMDFHFVQNLTMGPDFVNQIRAKSKKAIFVHLMVEFAEKYLDRLNLNSGDIVSVHIESPSTIPFPLLLEKIRQTGLIASIAINPYTPLEAIITCPTKIEHVLLMSVNPGFSGQKFLPHIFDKLVALNNFKQSHNLDFTIAVDGGITKEIAKELISSGAQQIVAASAIFKESNIYQAVLDFTKI